MWAYAGRVHVDLRAYASAYVSARGSHWLLLPGAERHMPSVVCLSACCASTRRVPGRLLWANLPSAWPPAVRQPAECLAACCASTCRVPGRLLWANLPSDWPPAVRQPAERLAACCASTCRVPGRLLCV
eukprot:366399-Chlamydomonas_euryale.AAC.20